MNSVDKKRLLNGVYYVKLPNMRCMRHFLQRFLEKLRPEKNRVVYRYV